MSATLYMLEAVTKVIDKARLINDNIPAVTVVLGAPGYTKKSQLHGHFASNAWKSRNDEESYGELLLSGESLKRGGRETVGTVLHELAHAYCHANDIKDTSNGNRYHNTRFKTVAEDFGLVIAQAKTIGWSLTTVPDYTAELYKEEIKELDNAITQYRVPRFEIGSKKAIKREMFCPTCQDRVVVTKGWWERNQFNLICEDHKKNFVMEEIDPNEGGN